MLSNTFDDLGGGANDSAFFVDLASSKAIFHRTEILQIIRGNCYTSQGDIDSSFPLRHPVNMELGVILTGLCLKFFKIFSSII